VSGVGDRRFVARATLALALAHARYFSSVSPLVRAQLRRWDARAAEIPDPFLRGLALGKLRNERFDFEAVAMIATIVPARYRERAVEAIMALQVMFAYLDALTEQPMADPIRDGLQYSRALVDAVSVSAAPRGDYYAYHQGGGDGNYLSDLAVAARGALMGLPAVDSIAEVISMTASRCAEAQVRVHAGTPLGNEQLQRWATREARGTELQWREWLFGAMGSVIAAHALIASAADDHTTRERANAIDSTYLLLCAVTTALDQAVDFEGDVLAGEQSYLHLYETPQILAEQIAGVARLLIERARTIPNGAHHAMILSGVVGYYTSEPGAMGEYAGPVTDHVRRELRPLITPALATMHAWRLAKRVRHRLKSSDKGPRLWLRGSG
jgi:tetraprenyl-beta-curcumene synthase